MKSVTKEELKKLIDDKADFVLIDALDKEDYDKEHIVGAINVPYEQVHDAAQKLDKKKKVIVYCSDFRCTASTIVAEKLEKYGFEDVAHYPGGMAEWKEAGYLTE